MHYTIYKITNKINDKTYIGMHKTANLKDGYMGSGKLIQRAIKKYGLDNFSKEILFDFNNEDDMKSKEKELVVLGENSYNLCPGGKGGFGYINTISEIKIKAGKSNFEKNKEQVSKNLKLGNAKSSGKGNKNWKEKTCDWTGRRHRPESIAKMKISKKGKNVGTSNSQYGTIWITNQIVNIKIKKEDLEKYSLMGYIRGRIKQLPLV